MNLRLIRRLSVLFAVTFASGAWAEPSGKHPDAVLQYLSDRALDTPTPNLLSAEKHFTTSTPDQPANSFEKAVGVTPESLVQWNLGGNLPLPTAEDERLGPNHKDVGFHFGLDFHPDKDWVVTGVAGVKMNNGPVTAPPTKPAMDQVGVEAKIRF
jgi:hypothetical protein